MNLNEGLTLEIRRCVSLMRRYTEIGRPEIANALEMEIATALLAIGRQEVVEMFHMHQRLKCYE